MSSEQEKKIFWQQFLAVANETTDLYEKSNIRKNKHYIHIQTDIANLYYSTVCKLDESWVEICIQREDDSEDFFNDLKKHQETIEKTFGEHLRWVNETEKQRCKIMISPVSKGRADNDVDGLSNLLVEKMVNFQNAIGPFLPVKRFSAKCLKSTRPPAISKVIKRRTLKVAPVVVTDNDSTRKADGNDISTVDSLFKKAMICRRCFENGVAVPANIDVPQPRLIGSQYFDSSPRVMVIALNPGAGNSPEKVASNRIFSQHLYDYKNDKETINDLFTFQAKYMENWGMPPGKYIRFYCDGIGLSLDNIAMANIAWCADINNRYPATMLNDCFRQHTGPLISTLDPSIVILSGGPTHKFAKNINQMLPDCLVIQTLHYAHREGKHIEEQELRVVREQIAQFT